MRVLFLTDSLSDLDGVGRYAVSLIAALEKQEPALEVEILLARKHRPTSSAVPSHWKTSVALPPDYFFHMSRLRFWASLLPASLKVARAARRADVVHAIKDYPHSLVGLLGARLAGRPCVATAHGTYSVQPLLSDRHATLARWACSRFATLVCVSAYTRDRILEALPRGALLPERVKVVPNAVDVEHFREARAIGPRPWHAHPFTLGIGEVKERKGHHLALAAWVRAARSRPDLHHYVVGKSGDDAYHGSLIRTLWESGLGERVRFLGNVTEDEKVDLLQRARVFLHTPVLAQDGGFEGFGLVYLEAAACGTPSIGTHGCGAEDAIDDGVTGLLVEPAEDAVAAALERLLSDADLRERLGAAGRERARRSSWDANARALLEIYAQVAR